MAEASVCQEQSEHSELEDRTGRQQRWRVPDTDLQTLLRRLVARYGTQTALAQAIHVTDSRLAKVLKGDSGAFSVLNCLRLAKVAGLSPSQVLRAAGKADIATLIEELYGEGANPTLSADDAADEWPSLSPKAQTLLNEFLDEVSPGARRRRPRPRVSKRHARSSADDKK